MPLHPSELRPEIARRVISVTGVGRVSGSHADWAQRKPVSGSRSVGSPNNRCAAR